LDSFIQKSPVIRRKDLGDMSYTREVMGDFSYFVFTAIGSASLDSPATKIPY